MIHINQTRYKAVMVRGRNRKGRERVITIREAPWHANAAVSLALFEERVDTERRRHQVGRWIGDWCPMLRHPIVTGDEYVASVLGVVENARRGERELIYEEA